MNNSDIDRIAALLSKRRYKVVICNDTEASNAGQKGALATALKIQESVSKRIAEGLGDESNEDTIARRLPDIRLATFTETAELEKIDVADYLQRGWKEQLIYWIESARELKRYQQYVEDDPTRFFDGKTFIPKELSDELRNEGRFLRVSLTSYTSTGTVSTFPMARSPRRRLLRSCSGNAILHV